MVCPLCYSHNLDKIQAPKKRYHHCSECDLIFLDKAWWLSPENEKKRYELHNNSADNQGYIDYLRQFISFIPTEFLTSGCEILDFGCGPEPLLSRLLTQQGANVRLYDRYFHDLENWQNQHYQTIVVHEVFEHLQYPGEYLKLWHQALHPEGRLIIRSHFHPPEIKDFLKWWYIQDSTHISFFSENSYKHLEKQGFWAIEKSDKKSMIILKKARPDT